MNTITLSQEQTKELISAMRTIDLRHGGGSPVINYVIDLYENYEFTFDEFKKFADSLTFMHKPIYKNRINAIENFKNTHPKKKEKNIYIDYAYGEKVIPATVVDRVEYNPIIVVDDEPKQIVSDDSREMVCALNDLNNSLVDSVATVIGDEKKELSKDIVESIVTSLDRDDIFKSVKDKIQDIPVVGLLKDTVRSYYEGSTEQKDLFKRRFKRSMKEYINKAINFSDEGNVVEDIIDDTIDIYPNIDIQTDLTANQLDYSEDTESSNNVKYEMAVVNDVSSDSSSTPSSIKVNKPNNKKDKNKRKDVVVMNSADVKDVKKHKEENKKVEASKQQPTSKVETQQRENPVQSKPMVQLNTSDPNWLASVAIKYCRNPFIFSDDLIFNNIDKSLRDNAPVLLGAALVPSVLNNKLNEIMSKGYTLLVDPRGDYDVEEVRILAASGNTYNVYPEVFQVIIRNFFDSNFTAYTYINNELDPTSCVKY